MQSGRITGIDKILQKPAEGACPRSPRVSGDSIVWSVLTHMSSYGSQPRKTPGSDTKPARIVLESGEEFDVAHHFVSERETWVCAYENGRDGGIDYRFPAASIAFIDTTGSDDARVDTTVTAPAAGGEQ